MKFKRWLAIRQAKKELSTVTLTGLALFDYLQEYTKDPKPWIQNPYGFFNNYEWKYVILANQKTGSISFLYR